MKNLFVATIILLTFSSCFQQKIITKQDKDIDISRAKTYSYYGWIEVNDMIDINRKAIEQAFAEEFKKRGLTYKETKGDIVVSLIVVVDKESTTNRYGNYYGYGPYSFYPPTWGWGVGYGYRGNSSFAGVPYKENAFYEGTLVCNVFDLKTKKLAWQGVISKAINLKNQNKTDIPKLTARLLRTFPIKVKE